MYGKLFNFKPLLYYTSEKAVFEKGSLHNVEVWGFDLCLYELHELYNN